MITKNDLLEAILAECGIIKRLYTKIPNGGMDYRPTPGQRSTLELLRYMSFGFIATAEAIVDGAWDGWNAREGAAKLMKPEEFPAAMDRQMGEFRALFSRMSEDEFSIKPVTNKMWQTNKPVGYKLMDHCFGFCVAYKMQLFLYAKSAGNQELGTADCWFIVE